MTTEYELSHQDSLTAKTNGLIVKSKIRYTVPDGDTEDDIDTDLVDLSDGLSGSEEDEILQSEDEVEKFISKRQMSYPPLPRYESPIMTLTSKEKLGILTPPIEESACNSIKSGRSSRNSMSRSRHVSFTMHTEEIVTENMVTSSSPHLQNGQQSSAASKGQISEKSPGSPTESNMSVSPPPGSASREHLQMEPDNHQEISEEDSVTDDEMGTDQGVNPEEIITRSKAWECSHNNLPMADLVLEGLIANFHKIQDFDALLLFTSEFGSHLKKVQPETIFRNLKDIGEILSTLCSTSSNFRLNMEALNATNSFADRLRQLSNSSKSLWGQLPEEARSDLSGLVKQLCSLCAESKSVLRTEAGGTFSKLIRGGGPRLVTEPLFRIISPTTKSTPKVKATALDALTLLLLIFPRDDFELEDVAKEVCSVLLSPKRRLRLAALECLAVVAHALGPTTAMPLFRQLIEQEISNGFRSSTLPRRNNVGGQSSASKAVSARVSRRVLPSASHSGLVNYAMIPLPTVSNRALYKVPQYEEEKDADLDLDEYGFLEPIMNTAGKKYNGHHMGADILYVLRGSGAATGLMNSSKSPNSGSPSSSGSDGKFERSAESVNKSGRLSVTRDSADVRRRQLQDETRREGTAFTGLSRVSPFNGPNVIKQQSDFSPKFIEQEVSAPSEFRYRYSSNDLRSPPKQNTFEYPRRGSEGYMNGNVRKSTPFSNPDFTVMTVEHSLNNIPYLGTKFLNGHQNQSDDEDGENGTRHENFVDESEEVESKKSSAGSSTRDSGVSSLKSAGRMLLNDSPPSTGERAEDEVDEVDEVEEVEIPELEHENEYEQEELPVTPKTPPYRGDSESVRSPTVTNQVSRLSLGTPDDKTTTMTMEPTHSSQYRNVENSPPPTPRLNSNGASPDERSDFILRKPAVVRSSPKNKLGIKSRAEMTEQQNRASTSPLPYRRTQTPSPVQNSYRSVVATANEESGRHAIESRNGNYRDSPKSTETVIQDYDDDVEDVTETDSSRNSRESTSSQPQMRSKLPQKCFLKKGLTTIIPSPPRRTYKGSFRESNSQGRNLNNSVSTEVFPQDMKPLDSPKHGLSQGMQKLASPEWEINLEGFRLIVRLIRYNKEFLFKPNSTELHNIILGGMRQLGNLRSQVCRAACLFFRELFTHLDPVASKGVEQDLEKITEKLLDKSMDTNKFIREDSGSALDSMVMVMPTNKCINVLDNYGTKHRNAIVRRTTARLLGIIIKKLGPERILSEHPDKALPMLVRFLQEGNLETRTHAKSSLSFLAQHPSFDSQLRRSVPLDLLRHSDKAINALKNDLKFARRSSTHRL